MVSIILIWVCFDDKKALGRVSIALFALFSSFVMYIPFFELLHLFFSQIYERGPLGFFPRCLKIHNIAVLPRNKFFLPGVHTKRCALAKRN
jgi:hypothetical protein